MNKVSLLVLIAIFSPMFIGCEERPSRMIWAEKKVVTLGKMLRASKGSYDADPKDRVVYEGSMRGFLKLHNGWRDESNDVHWIVKKYHRNAIGLDKKKYDKKGLWMDDVEESQRKVICISSPGDKNNGKFSVVILVFEENKVIYLTHCLSVDKVLLRSLQGK